MHGDIIERTVLALVHGFKFEIRRFAGQQRVNQRAKARLIHFRLDRPRPQVAKLFGGVAEVLARAAIDERLGSGSLMLNLRRKMPE